MICTRRFAHSEEKIKIFCHNIKIIMSCTSPFGFTYVCTTFNYYSDYDFYFVYFVMNLLLNNTSPISVSWGLTQLD